MLITGGEESIDIQPGDELMIEMPGDQQSLLVILACDDDLLILEPTGGGHVRLRRADADTALDDFKLSDGFSREIWIVQG